MTSAGSRYDTIWIFAKLYLGMSFLIRIMLMVFEGDAEVYTSLTTLIKIFSIGLLYDVAALAWMLIPFAIIALACSNSVRGRSIHKWLSSALFAGFAGSMVFNVGSEFLFWNEFSSRFNFIAVDYLVYTREVFGNIWQSYPMEAILAVIVVVTGVVLATIGRKYLAVAGLKSPAIKGRLTRTVGIGLLPLMSFFVIGDGPNNLLGKPVERELAWNGHYALFRAFNNNDLSYPVFYATVPESISKPIIAETYSVSDGTRVDRAIAPNMAAIKRNIVLINIESLGSKYVEAFGGHEGLTPNLSGLVKESLSFHDLYATGLRTVRGLEAITLSLPPTPGRAVPIRTRNKGLQSLGSVLNDQGYKSVYLYGGYSFFDNMHNFFSGNGYEVFDRTDIDDADIHHETIWGVADEDLYTLSLETIDAIDATSQPFFAHIMTTSNHRPYTYPEGRIDIPSKTSRAGAVKYTDWAIGNFLERARDKPWFDNTVFILVSDHTSGGRGRIDLPPKNFRIPMWIYAPGFVTPGRVDSTASLIDVAPTILAMLNVPYQSKFFGQNILDEGRTNQRAFMANYLTVGYMEDDKIVELRPQQTVRVVQGVDGSVISNDDTVASNLINKAISFYLLAANYIKEETLP